MPTVGWEETSSTPHSFCTIAKSFARVLDACLPFLGEQQQLLEVVPAHSEAGSKSVIRPGLQHLKELVPVPLAPVQVGLALRIFWVTHGTHSSTGASSKPNEGCSSGGACHSGMGCSRCVHNEVLRLGESHHSCRHERENSCDSSGTTLGR